MTESHKQYILLGCLIVASALFWYVVSMLLPILSWQSSPLLWTMIVFGILFAMLWALAVVLVENSFLLIIGAALMSFTGIVWFLDPIFISVCAVLFVFSVIGIYRTRFTIQNTLGGGLVRPLRKSVPLMVTFVVAVFSTAYYVNNATAEIRLENIMPENIFTTVTEFAAPTIQKIDPSFNASATVAESIINQAKREYPDLTKEQETLIVTESIKKYSENLKIQIKPSDTYMHVLYATGLSIMHAQTDQYKSYFPKVYAIILFFTLRVLAIPLTWLAIGLAIMLLRIFHRLGIVELRAVPATIFAYSFSSKSTFQ
jgi:hypothetical protein